MPQTINTRNCENPAGKGSLYYQLRESSLRTRRRVTKINEGVNSHLQRISRVIDKHQQAENERHASVMKRVQKTLDEIEAYKNVLQRNYRVDHLMTLQWGYKANKFENPDSFRRHQLEARIYQCGFTKDTLRTEIVDMMEMQNPQQRKKAACQKMLINAQQRSNFMIDRSITNKAMRKEHYAKLVAAGEMDRSAVSRAEDDWPGLPEQHRAKAISAGTPRDPVT